MEYISKLITPVTERNGDSLIHYESLPANRNVVGARSDWDSTPEGGTARAVLKGQYKFDYDDVSMEPVYYVGTAGTERTWYVPTARKYNAGRVRYDTLYAAIKIYPDLEKEAAEQRAREDADRAKLAADRAAQLKRQQEDLRVQYEERRAQLEMQKQEAELRRLEAEAQGGVMGGNTGITGGVTTPGMMRTYELYGTLNNMRVPFTQVAQRGVNGRWMLVPGGRAFIGDMPSDGYNLAGVPGAWNQLYPGQSPSNYGLDPDKGVVAYGSGGQGMRGYAVPAQVLSELFGPNWRAVVYG